MKVFCLSLLTAYVSAMEMEEKTGAFAMWSALFNKNYQTIEEFETRFEAWMEIDRVIEEVNAPDSEYTHTAAHNKFSDWTREEFKKMMNGVGVGPELPNPEVDQSLRAGLETTYNMTVDWTTGSCVNPVQDQGSCGSCWSFGATACTESSFCIDGGALYKLSEQQLVDCDTVLDSGCGGGLAFNAWEFLQTNGQMLESDYPYTATDGTCQYDASKGLVMTVPGAYKYQIDGTSGDANALMAKGVDIKPVEVSIHASEPIFQSYSSGVIRSECGTSTNHSVVIVGYSTDSFFWKVRNSWGPDWGDHGYVNIGWGYYPGVCGINQRVGYPFTQAWTG